MALTLLRHKKKIIAAVFLACMGYIYSCLAALPKEAPPMTAQNSAWLVYWDWQAGVEQAARREDEVLVAFAADFDRRDRLRLHEGVELGALKSFGGRRLYLSFVNDREDGGRQQLKDVALLHRLLDKPEARRRHIAEIIRLCKKHGFAGIEIDYENLWQDAALVDSFAKFIGELREEATAAELKLRVVLEPKTLEFADRLPARVEYVVMFYNLYGTHSGAGPKANEKFILRTLKRLERLGGTPNIAFANGGFDWSADGGAIGLSGRQAAALAEEYASEVKRDADSRSLYFSYEKGGAKHTVWYADAETLDFWRAVAAKYGYKRFSLWRLDGSE